MRIPLFFPTAVLANVQKSYALFKRIFKWRSSVTTVIFFPVWKRNNFWDHTVRIDHS
jgi:hypothetical protein